MVKLYHYDKITLKFKKIIELESLVGRNYEFCTLVAIPEYDAGTQYPEYDKTNDTWIVKDIIFPIININIVRERKIKNLTQNTKNAICSIYPLWKQISITNLVSDYKEIDKTEMIAFLSAKIDICNTKEVELELLDSIEDINNFDISIEI